MFNDIPKVTLCFVLAFALPLPSGLLAGAGFLLAAPAPSRAALLFTFFFVISSHWRLPEQLSGRMLHPEDSEQHCCSLMAHLLLLSGIYT